MANSKRPNDLDGAPLPDDEGPAAKHAHGPTKAKHKTVEELMAETPADPPRRQRRWPSKLAAMGLVLLLILGFAPQIISRTPMLSQVVAMGTTDLNGSVTLGSASLSWFSPPAATNVDVVDASGHSVATADEVSMNQGLLSLITAPNKLGRVKIERPTFAVSVGPDGKTNFEQVIAKYLEPLPAGAVPTTYEGEIELVDGKAEVRDEATGRTWRLEKLSGIVTLPAGSTPLSVDLRGVVKYADMDSPWSCRLNWFDAAAAGKPPAPQGDLALNVDAFPLEMAQVVAKRFAPGFNYAGTLSGKLDGKFDLAGEHPTAEIDGRITVTQFSLGGEKLGSDVIQMAVIDLPLTAKIAQNKLFIQRCGASCDLAGVRIEGELADYGRLFTAKNATDVAKLLAQGEGAITATVDLARIAQTLPHVMRVRDEVVLTGGAIGVTATAKTVNGVKTRRIDINTSGLTAMNRKTPVAWPHPLEASLVIGDGPTGPTIETLNCRSDFLVVEGVVKPTSFDVQAKCSLGTLMQRAGQFIDLDGIQLSGEGDIVGSWAREGNRFNVSGTAKIDGFNLIAPGYAPWTEQQLIVDLRAVGTAVGTIITNVEQAVVGVKSGQDVLTLTTGQPSVDFANFNLVVPVSLEGSGRLETWLTRIRPFAGLPQTMTAQGQAKLTAVGKFRPYSDFEITQSSLVAQPLRVTGYGLAIDEPAGELTLIGRYTPKQTTITEAKLTSPGTQAIVQNMIYATPTGRPTELKGTTSLRTDLARFILPSVVPIPVPGAPVPTTAGQVSWQYAGLLDATAKLQQTGNVTSIALETIVRDFAVGRNGQALWREPQIRVIGSGVYEPARDLATFERIEVAADAVRLLASGKVTDVATSCNLDVRGEATYDLARLAPIAQPYLGAGFTIEGRDTQPLQVVGPLFDTARGGAFAVDKLAAATRFGWDKMTVYGIPFGKTSFEARLDRGIVRTGLIDMPVASGRVRIAPELRLGPEPMELTLAPTPDIAAIDHIAITPEMVSERLKFIMPLVAGTTKVSGLFSMQFDEFRLPLDNPAAGSLGGRLKIHDVEIEPGLLMQEIAVMLQQPRTAKLARESVVDFKMIQGRIYHQNLEFAFPETAVRTSGSVGVADQSLSLMAELQLPSKLMGLVQAAQPTAAGPTAGPIVRLPIGGTLTKPTIDKDGFRQSVAQIVQQVAGQALLKAAGGGENAIQRGENAATGALNKGRSAAEQAIGRGLNRLLGPGAANPTPGTGTR